MKNESNEKKLISGERGFYPVSNQFIEWLESGMGRSAYFGKVDPLLSPPVISKIKAGRTPIDFATAIRLERAQKLSTAPFKAVDIMTFKEDQALYLYVSGQELAPAPVQRQRRHVVASSPVTSTTA